MKWEGTNLGMEFLFPSLGTATGSAQQAFSLLLFKETPCLFVYYDTVIHTELSAHQVVLNINWLCT